MTNPPYFKVSVRLDEVTPLEPNDQGYNRVNTDTVVDFVLVGQSPEMVLRQAHDHIGLLVAANAPVEVIAQ